MTSFSVKSIGLFAGIGILVLTIQGCSSSKPSEPNSETAKPKANQGIKAGAVSPNDMGKKKESSSEKATAVSEKKTILGDMDGDGKITASDAKIAANIAVGKLKATSAQLNAGDLNGDGKITISEATAILRAAKKGTPLHKSASH